MRIGYLGPEGTFSYEVACAGAAAGDELVGLPSNRDVVIAVQEGVVDRAVSPVENMIDGAVTAVLDALAFDAPDVSIVGEAVLEIRMALIAAAPLGLAEISEVRSHPVALAQCGEFLRASLPGVPTAAAGSTAEAVATLGGTAAAVAPPAAAARYGAVVLVDDIADADANRTRFAWLTRTANAGPDFAAAASSPAARTAVLFSGAKFDGSPGWLVRCLSEFAFRGVNLTKIESRPLRSQLGHYWFHLDCDGHAGSEPVAEAVKALRTHCQEVRVLGTYAAATATISGSHGGISTN